MNNSKPEIRWGRGFFRAWVVFSVIWVCLSGLIFHSEIKYKSTDRKLIIEGHDVTVDANFLRLSPGQQNATVDEIARSMGWLHSSTSDNLPEGFVIDDGPHAAYSWQSAPLDTGEIMTHSVAVIFTDGTSHTYQNVPDGITQKQVEARVQKDFGNAVAHIDSWRLGEVSDSSPLGPKNIVWSSVQFVAGLALIPPIIVLMLGIMTGWAISGFKRV